MSLKSKISWCDSTVNFWEGCTKVSPGCANCYAEARDRRMMIEPVIHWGKGAPRRKSKSAVKAALAMNSKPWTCSCGLSWTEESARKCSYICAHDAHAGYPVPMRRRRIFCLSLGDFWDGEVPIEWLVEGLYTVFRCDQCVWIICSKRWENAVEHLKKALKYAFYHAGQFTEEKAGFMDWLGAWFEGRPPRNIIGLCSVEDQQRADGRIPQFLTVPLACRGLSLEPLLGPVDAECFVNRGECAKARCVKGKVDWLIIGGESGPNARSCNVDWIRSLLKQGRAAGVATFVKQLGARPVGRWTASPQESGLGQGWPAGLKIIDKKGGDPSEWPAELRVQEWPSFAEAAAGRPKGY